VRQKSILGYCIVLYETAAQPTKVRHVSYYRLILSIGAPKSVFRACRAAPFNNCPKHWQGAFRGYCSGCYKLFGKGNPTAQPEAKRNNNERSPGDDVDVNVNGRGTNAARATNQPENINTTFARGINEIATTNVNIHNNSIDGETGGFENERLRHNHLSATTNVHNDRTTTNTAATADHPSNKSPCSAREFNHNGTKRTNAIATTNALNNDPIQVQNSIGDTQLLELGVPNNDSPSYTDQSYQKRTTGIDAIVMASALDNNGLHDRNSIGNQGLNSQYVTRQEFNLLLGRVTSLEHCIFQNNMHNHNAFRFLQQQLTTIGSESHLLKYIVHHLLQRIAHMANNRDTQNDGTQYFDTSSLGDFDLTFDNMEGVQDMENNDGMS